MPPVPTNISQFSQAPIVDTFGDIFFSAIVLDVPFSNFRPDFSVTLDTTLLCNAIESEASSNITFFKNKDFLCPDCFKLEPIASAQTQVCHEA